MREYLAVMIQIGAALSIAIGAIATSLLLGKRSQARGAKNMPYECGKPPIGEAHTRFSVKFYLIAMIFILFDIEVIFMYPWALSLSKLLAGGAGTQAFWGMFAFILIIEVGHLYAYKKGVFNWNK